MINIITLTGMSGTGKTTIARMITDNIDAQEIVSYTTRSMRTGETDGVEHHFVDEHPKMTNNPEIIAKYYDRSGRAWYWTEAKQFKEGETYVYVVDEGGLEQLRLSPEKYNLFSVLVERSRELRKGIDEKRLARDDKRTPLPRSTYDFIIKNNKSIEALKKHVVPELIAKIRQVI